MPNPSFNIWQVFLSQAASWFQSQLRHYIQLKLKRNIKVSYNVLLLFNRFWEILMGKECWTWNINWHLLLWQCVHDFGPVYSFRCFSLERLNGIIGKCVTNDKHVSSHNLWSNLPVNYFSFPEKSESRKFVIVVVIKIVKL